MLDESVIDEEMSVSELLALEELTEKPMFRNFTGADYSRSDFPMQMADDIQFNGTVLSSAIQNQAALYAYYASQAAFALREELRSKLSLETTEAELYDIHRSRLEAAGKKVTEKMLEFSIAEDTKYIKAKEAYNNAKVNATLLRDYLDALKQKGVNMLHVGVNRREERKGQLSIADTQ